MATVGCILLVNDPDRDIMPINITDKSLKKTTHYHQTFDILCGVDTSDFNRGKMSWAEAEPLRTKPKIWLRSQSRLHVSVTCLYCIYITVQDNNMACFSFWL